MGNGPKTLPCGTPDTTLTSLLLQPSTITCCDRSDRKCVNIVNTKPPIPTEQSLYRIPWWLTISKAAMKSIWTILASCPLSNALCSVKCILYINIVAHWCYSWESWMYSITITFCAARETFKCIHTYARMLTFCVTAIIYYIIINSVYAFIKRNNMIYHNCVYQGAVYNINQICQWHILITKPLKCLQQI